ncbi:helix-turn-helix domain-containing protein [Alteromonadaceae bacterium BrNp21-10]|nr:helix-turn-helix domain-containing protein [Alteromonadaceae bacterium BrNp21-10]
MSAISKEACPTETALDLIGGKWKGMILFYLCSDTQRFSELMRLIPDITQRMLTKQLRDLEASGIVYREVYPQVPPKVEYSLTGLGKTLEPVIRELEKWGKGYLQAL